MPINTEKEMKKLISINGKISGKNGGVNNAGDSVVIMDCSKLSMGKDDVFTKVHLDLFADVMMKVCRTKWEFDMFCVLMKKVRSGNMIYGEDIVKIKKHRPRSCIHVLDRLERMGVIKYVGDGGIIVSPFLMMCGIKKSGRKDILSAYRKL